VIKIRHMSKKIDIMSLYLEDYNRILSGREIARLTELNHQTALNHLKDLINEKIMKYNIKGRNKNYFLDLMNPKARILIEITESFKALKSLDNKELKFIIKDVLGFTEAIILFGSFASEKYNKNSDVDMVLLGKSNKNMINKVKKRYNREINIEYASFNDFYNSLRKKNALAIEILNNHIIYGDLSRIVDIFIRWYTR